MSTLHITNGDSVALKLRQVFDGPVSVVADVLHEGPAGALDPATWREQRARYLATAGYTTVEAASQTLAAWDDQIARAAEHDEVVLWFEHDLFDQLLLIRTLDMLGELRGDARPRQVSLICINAYLGHLSSAQLHGLWPTRAPVTTAQYATAGQAWQAFRQPDPSGLIAARRRLQGERDDCTPMPFLGAALERLFEEFPSTTNGLSRTADAVLRVLDRAAHRGADLFQRTQALEERMFLGDLGLFRIVREMADARVPLVALSPPGHLGDIAAAEIAITDAGRAVLRGDLDAVRLNGIDTWRGGVRLSGDAAWRWDPARKTLISWR